MNPELNDSAVTELKNIKVKFFTLQFA
jgi:hypothetical protein